MLAAFYFKKEKRRFVFLFQDAKNALFRIIHNLCILQKNVTI